MDAKLELQIILKEKLTRTHVNQEIKHCIHIMNFDSSLSQYRRQNESYIVTKLQYSSSHNIKAAISYVIKITEKLQKRT
jgi:hypothetical protein